MIDVVLYLTVTAGVAATVVWCHRAEQRTATRSNRARLETLRQQWREQMGWQ